MSALILVVILCVRNVVGDKGSLGFIIDDTASMGSDISQVVHSADTISDIIVSKNISQIENFILVTFNDPEVKLRTNTKNKYIFKEELKKIDVHGGGDCPEMSLTGVETALRNCSSGSYLYVFTDDSAKEDDKDKMIENIKYLATKKQSQIIFVITPNRNCRSFGKVFDEYYKVAAATSGQVFRLNKKDEVSAVLDYVKETVSGKRTVLTSKIIPANQWEVIFFTIDDKTEYAVVSCSGDDVQLDLKDGPTDSFDKVTWINSVKTMKLKMQGDYAIRVKGGGVTSIVVFGRTDFSFEYGFSQLRLISFKDTAKQPLADTEYYLGITIDNKDGDIEVKSAEILNMDETLNLSVNMTRVSNNFYVTELFTPPNMMFKLAIDAIVTTTGKHIRRISPTPIEPLKLTAISTITKEQVAPRIIIENAPKVTVDYKKNLELRCKVYAFPKPNVIWVDQLTGESFLSEVVTVEYPYDYISILNIIEAKSNTTYSCKAVNANGEDSKNIEVEITNYVYFNILERPTSIAHEYGEDAKVTCKVDAMPPATTIWYRKGNIVNNDGNFELSDDNSTLIINHIEKKTSGPYMCEVRNELNRKIFHFKVVLDAEFPKIDGKKLEDVRVEKGSNVLINCSILKGKPEPKLRWFFREQEREFEEELFIEDDVIYLAGVMPSMSGLYRCDATNEMGRDYRYIKFFVGKRPNMIEGNKIENAEDGKEKTLTCEAEGIPLPTVRWLVNGSDVTDYKKYLINRNSIRLTPKVSKDEGTYTCVATNEFGTAERNIELRVYIPVNIKAPGSTNVNLEIGQLLLLSCNADGYPRPEISWTFYKKSSTVPPQVIRSTDDSNYLKIPDVNIENEGIYTCTATNMDGFASLSYDVSVGAPPFIENKSLGKRIFAVKGDLLLSIPCKAFGNPKPDITWLHKDLPVTSDGKYFYIDGKGTLNIINVEEASSGFYTCQVKNILGNDTAKYEVQVKDYPNISYPLKELLLEEGTNQLVKCNIAHKKTDILKWYKDTELLTTGRLVLRPVKRSDAGIYTCRVSNMNNTRSESKNIIVGSPPKFKINDEDTFIEFDEENAAFLGCEAEGFPLPQVKWWHNDEKLEFNGELLVIPMKISNRGHYKCVVSNAFGSITRDFSVASTKNCIVHVVQDFKENVPLLLSEDNTFKLLPGSTKEGFFIIRGGETINLACADNFTIIPEATVTATCDKESSFDVDGRKLSFSDLKCKTSLKPRSRIIGTQCNGPDTITIEIGFAVKDDFVPVYEICLSQTKRIPLYSKHTIEKTFADRKIERKEWGKENYLPYDYDYLYDCGNQYSIISSISPTFSDYDDGCCFSKRQLVPPQDVLPGLNQIATYHNLNVLPHWSTCNSKNWNDIERRLRVLATSVEDNLVVWTGASQSILSIDDKLKRKYDVPRYFWKVVKDPVAKSSLAIIQVNIPHLKLSEAFSNVLCTDICYKVEWMNGTNWRDVNNGYTYCCSTKQFESTFDLNGLFDSANDVDFLKESSLLTEHSLTLD